jgi:hypothetical protein
MGFDDEYDVDGIMIVLGIVVLVVVVVIGASMYLDHMRERHATEWCDELPAERVYQLGLVCTSLESCRSSCVTAVLEKRVNMTGGLRL